MNDSILRLCGSDNYELSYNSSEGEAMSELEDSENCVNASK